MITEKRVVLIATNYEENDEFLQEFNFEGIKIITDTKEIESTWEKNKTPLMLRKYLTSEAEQRYQILDVPDYIFGVENFISFCHSNGFECGEYITGTKYDTSKDRCFLCGIADYMGIKGPLSLYNQKIKNEHDIIIYESANFFIKIELGCLVKGMVMICPKKHILSAARIPDELMEEYHTVMKDIEFILKSMYGEGPVIFFEHGSAPSGFSSHQRSIVHAHTHVAWGVKLEQKYIDMVCLKPVSDIRVSKDTKYLSYQEGTKGTLLLVNDPEVYIQRQYPRQVIGKMLGIDEEKTNWRKEPFTKNMTDTFHDFYRFLKANNSFLSERIVAATEGFVKGYPMREDYIDY